MATVQLAPPIILEPVSACNSVVWLDNLFVGDGSNTVSVFVNRVLRTTAQVTASTMAVGVGQLEIGDELRANQGSVPFVTSAGGVTPVTHGVRVCSPPAKPTDLGYPVAQEHIFDCALGGTFDGLFPGATVTVTSATNGVLGTGAAAGGKAIVQFTRPASGVISISQTACGVSGPSLPLTLDSELPSVMAPPEIHGTLRAGQQRIVLRELYVGSVIELSVGSTGDGYLAIATSRQQTLTVPPLEVGDSVRVRQVAPGCRDGNWSPPKLAIELSAPAPQVASPVRHGDTSVRLTGAMPGATIILYTFSDWHAYVTVATGETCDIFIPDGLPETTLGLIAYQTLREFEEVRAWSPPSDPVHIDTVPSESAVPAISAPVLAGASVVAVSNAPNNAEVIIEMRDWTDTATWFAIGRARAESSGTAVPVNACFLTAGRRCRPVVVQAGVRTTGAAVNVGSARPSPFTIIHANASDRPVMTTVLDSGPIEVAGLHPGALVDIYRATTTNNVLTYEWLATFPAAASAANFERPGPVRGGDELVAVQRIDGLSSPASAPTAVILGDVLLDNIQTLCELTGPGLT